LTGKGADDRMIPVKGTMNGHNLSLVPGQGLKLPKVAHVQERGTKGGGKARSLPSHRAKGDWPWR